MHSHIIKHIFNYTNQMHNIASLYIFTVRLPHVSVLTPSSARTVCPLLKTTCCYTPIVYGFYNTYFGNTRIIGTAAFTEGTIIYTVVGHRCCTTVLYVKNLKIYEKKSSVYYSHTLTYVRVAFHGTLRKLNFM